MGLLLALTDFESGNRNIPNTTKGTSSGQAQGYQQITTGTWNDFAPDAGVDLTKYPTPMSAPPDVQWKVASTIPLRRWAPETLAYLRQRGFKLDPDLSLGENVAANGGSPANWFSGAKWAGPGSSAGGSPYQTLAGVADPFADLRAAQSVASSVGPTNAMTGQKYQSLSGGADPFADLRSQSATPQVSTTPVQITPPLANAQPGANGLVWDANGGHDPKTGELVIAGQPFQGGVAHPQMLAGAMGVLGGVPIAGPYLQAGAERAAAAYNALTNGGAYGDNLNAIQGEVAGAQGSYPKTTTAGNVLGGIAGTVPMIMAAPEMFGADAAAPLWANALSGAASGGALGGLDTAVRENAAGQPISPQAVGTNALIGAALGGAAPALGSALGATGRMLGGGKMAPEDAVVARSALDAGYPLTAGQLSNDTGFKFLSSVSDRLPFSGSSDNAAQIQGAVNRKAAEAIGEQADALTPQVMQRAKSRIGNVFDTVAANTTVKADSKFLGALADVDDEMRNASGMAPNEVEPIAKAIDNIIGKVSNGEITGQQYLDLTRSGTPLSQLANNPNPNISHYASQVKDALQDALSRSASPKDQAALATAKQQYRNLMTVDGAVSRDGRGNVNPVTLATQANTGKFNANDIVYGRAGPLGDIAMLGQAFMKQMPSSGTAERLGWLGAAAKMGAGAAAVASGTLGGLAGAAGVPAALMANRLLVNPILRSRYLANALVNRSLPGALENPGIGRPLLQGGALSVGNALSGQ